MAWLLLLCATAEGGAPASELTGDWFCVRPTLADCGITLDLDVAHFYQGVATGGLDERFAYGGHGDYVANLDLGKLAGREGLFLKLRAEHRFGQNVNADTGAFLPAAVLADLPVADDESLFLTNVLFTQFLSERFAVFFGKLDTLDGDLNAFAHGRGKTQFSNIGFVSTPIALRTVPYSTLGCGFTILGDEQTPVFSFTLLNPTDTASTSGFDELFAEGVSIAAELRTPTTVFGRPGHVLLGATYSNREYVGLDQDPRIVLPSVPIARQTGSWSLYTNFDHFLHVDPCDPTRGWGLFGRAAVADDETNPIEWFLSFGVGGNNPHRGREADTFGVGWLYTGTSDGVAPFLSSAFLGGLGDGQAVEFFYNWQATPWLNVTPDLQVIFPARGDADGALVLGLRAVMRL